MRWFFVYRVEKEKAQLKSEIADLQDQVVNVSKKGVSVILMVLNRNSVLHDIALH